MSGNKGISITEAELRQLNDLLDRYYRLLKLAPKPMVDEAYWKCVRAGIWPDVKPWPRDEKSE